MKVQVWKWASILSVLMGLATMSPAPIKDPKSAQHEIGQHSAQQRQKDMEHNGTIGVVGSVPAKTNEDGTGVDPVTGDAAAKSIVAAAPLASDRKAMQTLAQAGKQIKEQQEDAQTPWLTILVIFLLGFGAFQAAKFWLEKSGPAPKARTRYAAGKPLAISEEEVWS